MLFRRGWHSKIILINKPLTEVSDSFSENNHKTGRDHLYNFKGFIYVTIPSLDINTNINMLIKVRSSWSNISCHYTQLLAAFGCKGLTRANRDKPRRRLWVGDFTDTLASGLRLLLPDTAAKRQITWCWERQKSRNKGQFIKQKRQKKELSVILLCRFYQVTY